VGNLRRTQAGSFQGNVLYKVRRKSTGLFFKPEYRNPVWEEGGRTYKTVHAARTAAQNATEKDGAGGSHLIDPSDLELVEFHVQEVATHAV
jgi:hypothetical protein